MSERKEQRRRAFRDAVYQAANYHCQGPGCRVRATRESAQETLDAHHIISRKAIPFEGYVRENGAALCTACHVLAEDCEQGRAIHVGFMPDDLYRVTGSSRELAQAAALRLGPDGELARRSAPKR